MIAPVNDAARLTGVPAGTIRRWLAEGRIVQHERRDRVAVNLTEVVQLRELLRRAGRGDLTGAGQ